jgi:hypothetical protein
MTKLHQESPSQSMLTLTLEQQVWLKRQRVALARRDVLRDGDVKRRGSGATLDARAMGIAIRSLGLFGLLLLRIYWVLVVLIKIECICHLNKTIYIKYRGYVMKC